MSIILQDTLVDIEDVKEVQIFEKHKISSIGLATTYFGQQEFDS